MTDFHRSQNYDSLRKKLLSSNTLFRDDKFPADNSLLTDNHGGVVSYWRGNRMNGSEIEWLRPAVIYFQSLRATNISYSISANC